MWKALRSFVAPVMLAAITVACSASGVPHGRIVVETLHSDALKGNLIGDTTERQVTIYLPPSYDRDPARRYPVAYLLHGFTSDPKEWLDGTYQGLNLAELLDQRAGDAEYLVVMPLANNSFGGGFYVNSAAFGRWEDFVVSELVPFIDARFRTLPARQSRALAGQSMGGFGALYLSGRHADTFGHVYAMSPCCLGFVGDLAPDSDRWRAGTQRGWARAMAAAFGPTPLSAGLPFVPDAGGQLREVADVARAWREYLPIDRAQRDPAPYGKLCSIAIEAGRQDEIPNVPEGAAAFARVMTGAGIANTLDVFTGGHTDRTRARFETAVLPFFARVLATAERAGTCATAPPRF